MELFVYSVRWYCDTGSDGKMITSSGVVAAENMGDAVHRLTTELYEAVEWVHLYCVECGDNGYADINDINQIIIAHKLVSEL